MLRLSLEPGVTGMTCNLFAHYQAQVGSPEPTLELAFYLALQAVAASDAAPQPLAERQLFYAVFCSLPGELRHPRRWDELLLAKVDEGHLARPEDLGDGELLVEPAGRQRSVELFGTLPRRWPVVPKTELNLLAWSTPDDLSWEYQRGILWKVYHRGTTYAYPRRLRRELGPEWLTYMPPAFEEGWNAVEALESTVSRFAPVPPTAWDLPSPV